LGVVISAPCADHDAAMTLLSARVGPLFQVRKASCKFGSVLVTSAQSVAPLPGLRGGRLALRGSGRKRRSRGDGNKQDLTPSSSPALRLIRTCFLIFEGGQPMKSILFAILSIVSPLALGDDWVLVTSDSLNSTFLDAGSVSRSAANETRFRIKLVYTKRRDMMGLPYDSATKDYVVACDSNRILSQQHFLLDGDRMVWTFPPSNESASADAELPGEVLLRVCG
jgi:hypothetical protein